ncbi:MAG: MBOAT family protein, partial [Lachnospiraceae bacterium]
MLFNSAVFVFAFLPLVFLGYYGLRYLKLHVPAKLYLLAASLFFYGYFSPRYLLILIGSIVINYLVYLVLMRLPVSEGGRGIRRGVMLVAVTLNLASIVYFKYYDFFIENINAVTKASLPLLHVALPLGISFFTFQQISFVIDT